MTPASARAGTQNLLEEHDLNIFVPAGQERGSRLAEQMAAGE